MSFTEQNSISPVADTEGQNKRLRRVVIISGMNGWSIALLAGAGTLIALLLGSWVGFLTGLLITASGVMELMGRKMIKEGQPEAGKWLATSQLWLLGVIICYACYQMIYFDAAQLLEILTPGQIKIIETGFDLPTQAFTTVISQIYCLFYITIIIVSILYQGGLWLFYRKSAFQILGKSTIT